ncbi:hydrogenase-1 expression HyaE [Roseibium sp. MMSF_3544]|uniref:hydrogenase-1 expression HyaE n=1 Tax=unclassified Roseibium TaxID=2629323 RepID=UPI00273CFE6C|nr:hydrogenase-1 expression HyaE [Roseibium sp. MMSF_3544]
MFSPLLTSIIAREGLKVVNEEALDKSAAETVFTMVFFPGDAERLAESNDVAVILPELSKALQGSVTPLIVDRSCERELQRRYRFNSFPSLVFLRYGAYLGVIQGVRDWTDYLNEISEILTREPTEPPAFRFPEGCGVQPAALS